MSAMMFANDSMHSPNIMMMMMVMRMRMNVVVMMVMPTHPPELGVHG